MAYLTAAVVFVAALCFLNLLVTFAIIRRLRHELGGQGLAQRMGDPLIPARGTRVPDFSAVTTAGAPVSLTSLAGQPSVVAIFAADCPSCRTHVGEFADFVRVFPGGGEHALAVVTGDPIEGADLVQSLQGVAPVVVEPADGPIAAAFSLQSFPTFYLLDEDSRIESVSWVMRSLGVAETV